MLLRRITEHVKDQNWFAVGIDFAIVVIGVFIGMQVANWNSATEERLSEAQYLDRFATELELTIEQIQVERDFTGNSIASIERFTTELFEVEASDAELISATQRFITDGAFFADFNPHRSTFDDLITTGHFDVISDETIRANLIDLYALYDDAKDTIESNQEWIQQGEDRVLYEFDAFRFDDRTSLLFDELPVDQLAEDIRTNKAILRRHAAFHYWLKVRSLEVYDEVEPEAQNMLDLIRAERDH